VSLKKLGIGVLAVAVVVATTLIVKRLLVTDRERVARAVGKLARHLEKRDVGSFCLLLAEDYEDSRGHTRASLRSQLTQGLAFFESLTVTVQDLDIEVRGDEAEAEFLVVSAARGRGVTRPWNWETRVRLIFVHRGREWRVVRADYSLPGRANF